MVKSVCWWCWSFDESILICICAVFSVLLRCVTKGLSFSYLGEDRFRNDVLQSLGLKFASARFFVFVATCNKNHECRRE